jgi:ATP-binding cassette subfamily A (ABC1) protein 3
LGPNGAGKSTTFNILTALIPKSGGSATLLGNEVNRNMPELFQNVGVCPQFNCLWNVMTVREHLKLFGGLKGYDTIDIEMSIQYFIDVLSLGEYANKRAMNLSGGNKRKLCVANCLIGSPKLMFFDEPSTGLDPLAKRFLWHSLQQTLKARESSIVLTTHSMTEAESLGHKTGILINGRFFCIGQTELLKKKYGVGYKITIQRNQNKPSVAQEILRVFPNSFLIQDGSQNKETYQINNPDFKFSSAFKVLESFKETGAIEDFAIYNTTLEQVFLHFSRFQMNIEIPQA